jgi:glycosyltransferase involved in cell wall biosynthesis
MTDISVVMGVYNTADSLRETLDSIVGQQAADFELVAVDDGSTDASGAILDEYAGAQVRVLHQPNRGLTQALIAGCAAAHGTFIARHDAGDLSKPDRLRKQRALFDREPRLVLAACTTELVGPRGEHLMMSGTSPAASQPIAMLDSSAPHGIAAGPAHHGSAMFRRDAYERAGGYRAAFYYGQDWDLWYRLGALGLFQNIDEPLYVARITPDSISGSARAAQRRFAELSHAALLARLRGESDDAILREASAIPRGGTTNRARGLYFIGEALRRNRDPRARGYLRDALRADPLYARAWLRYAQLLLSK